MLVLLQTILGLHPAGALRATRFVPDESVTSMTRSMVKQFPKQWIALAAFLFLLLLPDIPALAHGIGAEDQGFLLRSTGIQLVPYIYLGAKHMVTGYDHLLYLAGVVFFLYHVRDVAVYVTLFAVGHSTTLLLGVLGGIHANPWVIDAIIGLSVVYKAFENIGGFRRLGWRISSRLMVLVFGFFHGFGLATKLQTLSLSGEGLVANILAFNLGVELGQFIALGLIIIVINLWRLTDGFTRHSLLANTLLMASGFTLAGYQMAGYYTN